MKHKSHQYMLAMQYKVKPTKRAAKMKKSPVQLPLDVAADQPLLVWGLTRHPGWVASMVK